MAYADKITTMRRCALIYPKHNIVWEGVLIEDSFLLKKVDSYQTLIIKEEELLEGLEFGEFDNLELKYQDKETSKYWEPRKS